MPDEEMIERCVMAANSQFIGESNIINIIKAMREPTEKMIKAADVGMQSDFYPPDMTWQIMIDEILK